VFVTTCATFLAQEYPSPMSITIAGTNKAIEVDGFADDDLWADIDATLQIAWNEVGLLIFMDIIDDMENYFASGENTWEQDNAEFFQVFTSLT